MTPMNAPIAWALKRADAAPCPIPKRASKTGMSGP